MRDPHVVALHYRVVTDETVTFENPPPVDRETDAFRMRLADGVLTFEMRQHYGSERTARKVVETYLRQWETYMELTSRRREMSFVFDGAKIIDRDPPPPGEKHVVSASAVIKLEGARVSARAHIPRTRYPEPPAQFLISPDVETMFQRFQGYLEGCEHLASMAYMCLTVLEASAGGRKEAANQYGVDFAVLNKLGQLVSEIGDPQTARKVPKGGYRPHTGAEKAWIEAVVRAMILRVGEWAVAPSTGRPKLTMADFPLLN